MRLFLCWIACLAMALLTGCGKLGPAYIEKSRGSYIDVIAQTDREELLANLVRLRHSEAPVFVQIDSITSSPDLGFRVGSDITIDSSVVSTAKLTPSISYTEQPTIVFKPLLGREFSKELLLPISLMPIFILLENGWSLDAVLLPLARSINGVRNYDQQFNQSAAFSAEYRSFTDAVVALGNMHRNGLISIGTEGTGEAPSALVMVINPAAKNSQNWLRAAKIFNLDESAGEIRLGVGLNGSPSTLAMETRPLMGTMRYLSSFIEEGSLRPAILDRSVHDRLGFSVNATSDAPEGAIVAIQHRGVWFSIDAADIRSKEIFMMLRVLFNLQAQQSSASSGVALTLPVR